MSAIQTVTLCCNGIRPSGKGCNAHANIYECVAPNIARKLARSDAGWVFEFRDGKWIDLCPECAPQAETPNDAVSVETEPHKETIHSEPGIVAAAREALAWIGDITASEAVTTSDKDYGWAIMESLEQAIAKTEGGAK